MKILVSADETSGSGWVFLCEHVTLLAGLGVDSVVTRGRQIVTNPMESAFGNHPELAHAFSNHRFHENQSCWVDQLDTASRDDLANWFDTQLRTDPWFIAAWQTITFTVTFNEGQFPFRELLDPAKYPDGARLCYPLGADERVES